ncbi:MAG: hypothetical protein NZ576_09645, partial [Bacteroidia bacterium]|nr:hypothetical protein [Bacteroidia bacterium]
MKKLYTYLGGVFFASIVFATLVSFQAGYSQTWYVDKNNPLPGSGNGTLQNPFKTISAAILAANAWGANPNNTNVQKTIFVAPGLYTGELNMGITVSRLKITGNPGSLSVPGPDPNAPIIDGQNANAYAFNIAAGVDSVIIEGFFIRNYNGTPNLNAPAILGNTFGTGINIVNTVNNNSTHIYITDNEFSNLATAIFLTSPGSSTTVLGGLFDNLMIKNNIINTVGNSFHGIYIENPNNALIENNRIIGNNVVSAEVGLELSIRNNTNPVQTITAENITITNNRFEYNQHCNLVINARSNTSNTIFRNFTIQNNFFLNNNTTVSNINAAINNYTNGGRLIRISDNGQNNPRISNINITDNTFQYLITNGTNSNAQSNWAIRIEDAQGQNTFLRNAYTSTFSPASLTVNTSCGEFHALSFDYDNNPGDWLIQDNTLTGHNLNKPNDVGAAIHFWDLTSLVQTFNIQNNFISNFVSAARIRNTISAAEIGRISMRFNHLAGNRVGVVNNGGGLFDASFNWWGDRDAQNVGDYVDGQNVPIAPLCGTASACDVNSGQSYNVTPGGLGLPSIPSVDYTPWLDVGTDMSTMVGFQPNLSYLHVDRASPQSPGLMGTHCRVTSTTPYPFCGSYGRVGEALEEILDNGTIYIYDRGIDAFYNEGYTNEVKRNVKFDSNGEPIIDNLKMNTTNPNAKLTLLASIRVSRELNLQSGKIELGNKNLTVVCWPTQGLNLKPIVQPIISGGNSNSYVITNGIGKLRRDCIGGGVTALNTDGTYDPVKFPIGTISHYLPVTFQNTQSDPNLAPDRIGIRVVEQVQEIPGVFGNPLSSVVQATWFIDEACPNNVPACTYAPSLNAFPNGFTNNNVNLTLEWPASAEGPTFNRNACVIKEFTSNAWISVPGNGGTTSAANGIGPYSRTANGLTGQFIEKAFAVFSECPVPPVAPATVARCDAGPLTFTITYGTPVTPPVIPDGIYIYEVPTGGVPIAIFNTSPVTFTTPPLALGTAKDYYITTFKTGSCESKRIKVTVSAAAAPSTPIVDAPIVARCGPGPVTFSAKMGALAGSAIHLISDINNPASIVATATAPDPQGNYLLTTPAITTTTNYGIIASTNNLCNSAAIPVQAVINSLPAAPTAQDATRCGPGIITFSVTMNTPAGNLVQLYSTSILGAPIASDNTFPYVLSVTINNTVTWYVEAVNTTTGCTSATRTPVVLNVANQVIGTPSVINSLITRCGAGEVSIPTTMGTPPGDRFRVYNADLPGGTLLYESPIISGNTFTISLNVVTSSTFYISALESNTGCESNRTPVSVQIEEIPVPPFVPSLTRCQASVFTFTATLGLPSGIGIRVYSLANASTPIFTDVVAPFEFTTPLLNTTTSYFFAAFNQSCESSRTLAVATIGTPTPPTVNNVFICQPSIATFTVQVGQSGNLQVRMFTQSSGGSPIQVTNTSPYILSTNSVISTTTTFWFSVLDIDANCESARVSAVVNFSTPPAPPQSGSFTRCGAGNLVVTATSIDGLASEIRLYSVPTGGIPVAIDNTPPFELSAFAATNTTWYLESYNASTMCVSTSRTPISITITPGIGTPTVSDLTICGQKVATFTATMGSPAGTEIRLFTSATSSNPVFVDAFPPYLLTTPINSLGTNQYFIAAFDATRNCESQRVPAVVTAITPPAAPAANNVNRCGSGGVTITATVSQGANIHVRLYSLPLAGSPLITSTNTPFLLSTPTLNTNSTFYLESLDIATGCPSSTRTPVVALINPLPPSPIVNPVSRCQGGIVTFTLVTTTTTNNITANLYANPNDNLPLSTQNVAPYTLSVSINTTTTFYFEVVDNTTSCRSNRVASVARVEDIPPAPQVNNTARCSTGVVTFTATFAMPNPNYQVQLYSSSLIDATPLAIDAQPPYLLTTPIITTNSTFYIENFNPLTNCRSSRLPVVATIHTIRPGAPIANGVTRCGRGEITITANFTTPAATEFRLYTSSTALQPIATSNTTPGLLTILANSSRTYFLSAFDQSTGCESERSEIPVTLLTAPPPPIANDVSRCGAGSVVLTIISQANSNNIELRIYEAVDSDIPVFQSVGNTLEYQTPTLFTTTTYYLSSFNATNNCESSQKTPVTITIHPRPGNVTAANQTVCGGNGSVNFVPILAAPQADEVRLYTQPVGGTPINISNVPPFMLSSPEVFVTTIFYIEGVFLQTGCTSPQRTPVAAIVSSTPLPGVPSAQNVARCGSGSVTFSISPGNPAGSLFRLYTVSAGGSALQETTSFNLFIQSPSITTTTTFYLAAVSGVNGCESTRFPVQAIINDIPTPPTVSVQPLCGTGVTTISVTMGIIGGNEARLYSTESGGSLLGSATFFPYILTTPVVSGTSTFYVESFNSQTGCVSPRTIAIVRSNTPPSIPIVQNVRRCGTGPVNITVQNGAVAGDILRLYTQAQGGLPIATDNTVPYEFTTDLLFSTTTYYAEAFHSQTGCVSSRVPVVVTIDPNPGLPAVPNVTRCGPGGVQIKAFMGQPSGNIIRIYDSEIGGNIVGFDNSAPYEINLPIVNQTTTFYATAFNSTTGCESARVSVVVTVHPALATPVAQALSRCGSGIITITPLGFNNEANTIRLFNTPSGGSVVASSNVLPFTLPITVATSAVYYIEAINTITGCSSARSAVAINVNPIPGNITAASPQRCGAGSLLITPMMMQPLGSEVRLYESTNSLSPLAVSNNSPYIIQTPIITTTTTFWIASFDASTGCESSRASIVARINPQPGIPFASNVTRCGTGAVTFTANAGLPSGNELRLYAEAVGGVPVATDASFPYELVTPTTAITTTFYLTSFNTSTGCESNRVPVLATIHTQPGIPSAIDQVRCGRGSVTFSVEMGVPAGNSIRLYATNQGGAPLSVDNAFPYELTTPFINTSTAFYIASVNSANNCESERILVNV